MLLNAPDKVATQIGKMREGERYRAPQRSLLNDFFNGNPPWTKKEAADNHILINFNDKQGANLLHQARNQYENAFAKRETFFKVTLPECKDDQAEHYAAVITKHINRPLKDSRPYYYTMDEVWGGIVLHGIGARIWHDDQLWRPVFVGIQDILIPTETHLNMDNLQCFAVRRRMKPGLLWRKTLAKKDKADPGWNIKAVSKILDTYKDLNTNEQNFNWLDNPERLSEIWKQSSGGYYDGDIAPTIDLWDFYHLEDGQGDTKPGWYHKIMLDKDCGGGASEMAREFVYESKGPVAPSLDRLIHFQFGDGNNVPPFMYHSIRSLAYMIYDLVWTMNRLKCQFTQHLFEQLMTMVRVQDPADRGRLNRVVLSPPFCVIPEGLNLVAGNERYKADANLLDMGMSQYKQSVGELTTAYTQNLDTGTAKERTKFEVQTLLAQTSALMASMLGRAYRQEHWACVEIARRFAIENSHDFDVKKFRVRCIRDGVPERYIKAEEWQIEIEQVLGNGSRAMELAEANELFSNLGAFDPAAQQEIKHDWALAVTGNPKKAARLAPIDPKLKTSASAHDAGLAFGSLWAGAELSPVEGMNHTEQVGTLLGLMAGKIQQIMQGGQPTEADLKGFASVAVFIAKNLKLMSGDNKNEPVVKQFTEQLNEVMGIVEQMASTIEPSGEQVDTETQAKVRQIDALTQAKVQSSQTLTMNKAKLGDLSAQLKLGQKSQSHQQKLQQSEQSHSLAEMLKAMGAKHDEAIKDMEARNNVFLSRLEAAMAPKKEPSKES